MHGQTVLRPGGRADHIGGDPGAGRLRVSGRFRGRAHVPRPEGVPDLRGHQRHPETGYRPAVGPGIGVKGSISSIPQSVKWRVLRVATAKPWDWAIAAIWMSAIPMFFPALRSPAARAEHIFQVIIMCAFQVGSRAPLLFSPSTEQGCIF